MNPYSPFKEKTGFKRVIHATHYSISGFKTAFMNKAAFRQIVFINLILISAGFFLNVARIEQVMMIAVCLLVLIVELFNSAIEA